MGVTVNLIHSSFFLFSEKVTWWERSYDFINWEIINYPQSTIAQLKGCSKDSGMQGALWAIAAPCRTVGSIQPSQWPLWTVSRQPPQCNSQDWGISRHFRLFERLWQRACCWGTEPSWKTQQLSNGLLTFNLKRISEESEELKVMASWWETNKNWTDWQEAFT